MMYNIFIFCKYRIRPIFAYYSININIQINNKYLMKSKVYIVLFIAIVAIIGLIKVNSNLRKETRRLSNNVFAISDTLIKERDNNGILQVKALELSMKNDELEQSKSALLSKLKKEAENSNVSQKR